jgi:hypothetical protein
MVINHGPSLSSPAISLPAKRHQTPWPACMVIADQDDGIR